MINSDAKSLTIGTGSQARRVAVRVAAGTGPGLFWLGGFHSDMQGSKAQALARWAAENRRACVRFDYSGHGESDGAVTDGTIGRWLEEAVAVFTAFCHGPQIVIGSSMGGWIALLLLRELRRRAEQTLLSPACEVAALAPPPRLAAEGREGDRPRAPVSEAAPTLPRERGREQAAFGASPSSPTNVIGLVLIAPAVDFTEVLMWQKFPRAVKRELEEKGVWERPSAYSERPYLITRRLIEDGRHHLLLDGMIEPGCPVRILHGVKDADVPWTHAAELVARIARDDVVFTLIKDGDHRLSRPEDIDRLLTAVAEFS
jgi:pimeloyl-ACP methyl ester carboxylesterase